MKENFNKKFGRPSEGCLLKMNRNGRPLRKDQNVYRFQNLMFRLSTDRMLREN